jgi:hypothetical protein
MQGTNVVRAPASKTNSIHSKDIYVSPTQQNSPIWNKESISPP